MGDCFVFSFSHSIIYYILVEIIEKVLIALFFSKIRPIADSLFRSIYSASITCLNMNFFIFDLVKVTFIYFFNFSFCVSQMK